MLGSDNVIAEPERLRVYECDALSAYRTLPELVVLPETVEQVRALMRLCRDHRVPVVPRGRIYLIKQLLEGEAATPDSWRHLDRCLTCRACESACPSGVEYHRLLDIGRDIAEKSLVRPWRQRWLRQCLLAVLPYSRRVGMLVTVGRVLRPLLPETIKTKLPGKQWPSAWPESRHERRMLILEGCVQPALAPQINAATARVLDRLGISLIRVPAAACCGALPYHLDAQDAGL